MGTNDFVIPMFERLRNEHEILAVFTRLPKPAGRKMVLKKSPVHIWAEENNISVFHNTKEYNFKPDFVVVASYGVIIRDNILGSAPCINIHPSRLPKYRGASPMQTAILNGENQSAVCLIKMTDEVDAGDIYLSCGFEIFENDTTADVENKVSVIGADILSGYLSDPEKYTPKPQIGTPTFTYKFEKKDYDIDWNKSPNDIHNLVRALGFGRTKINGIDVKILKTKITDAELEILIVQPAGKKSMDWSAFINGQRGQIELGK